jgi:hypothetical protein
LSECHRQGADVRRRQKVPINAAVGLELRLLLY